MIDYVKIYVLNPNIGKIRKHPKLSFVTEVVNDTGECNPIEVSRFHNMIITIKHNQFIELTGSIHKLWNAIYNSELHEMGCKNSNGFNGNDFTYKEIKLMSNLLCDLLYCEPCQLEFKNIEFGVNLNVGFNPKELLRGLMYHKGRGFVRMYNGYYCKVEHQRFWIKIYDKSYHFAMKNYVLRVEVKLKRSVIFKNELGIRSFKDINIETLNKAKEYLLRRLGEVVYYDHTINPERLSKQNLRQLDKYKNSDFWLYELKPQHRDRHKKNLTNIISKNSTCLMQRVINDADKKCVIINST